MNFKKLLIILPLLINWYASLGQLNSGNLISTKQEIAGEITEHRSYTVTPEIKNILFSKTGITLFTESLQVHQIHTISEIEEHTPEWRNYICKDGSIFVVKVLTFTDIPVYIRYYSPDRKIVVQYL